MYAVSSVAAMAGFDAGLQVHAMAVLQATDKLQLSPAKHCQLLQVTVSSLTWVGPHC